MSSANNPVTAAMADVSRMLIFPMSVMTGSVNARLLMKMDMVNPMPPRSPIAATCPHVTPSGSEAAPVLTPMKLSRNMPRGLPMSSPKNIPSDTGGMPSDGSAAVTTAG